MRILKTIMTNHYILKFLILLLIISCKQESGKKILRRIINNTEHQIKIKIGNNGSSIYQNSILPYDTLNIEGTCGSDERDDICFAGWRSANHGTIIFSDSMKLMTTFDLSSGLACDVKTINAHVGWCYGYSLNEDDEDGVDVYTFTITEEDFENAIPIQN